ncbi:type II secretion system F family protein [Mycobacterium sp. M1]|uniref:Type II secretion system F family protein n=1 Tax=Mycolicibacter acidiphilus TaxID=2835306 RepID=A0ABS5RI03_9MYCO|nr:type II secretion system F family protein [Mycolicibacter acidiphilus]MBS9533229.1 type II secretion system F family protein [Mycolicibacter acidiphilus]
MTGPVLAALTLAAAVLLPAAPRRRLGAPARPAFGLRRRVVAAVVAGCCAASALVMLPPATCLAGAALVATLTVRHHRARRRAAAARETAALHAALGALVAELQAGSDPVRAFAEAATETEEAPVAAALRGVAARARLGADVAAGLSDAAVGSALPALWNWLAVYWRLGSEHGIAIATLMCAAQSDIAARQRLSARADAGMAGARTSAAILAALPALGLLLGQLIGARPIGFLLSRSGGAVSVAGVLLACAGLLWSDRITSRAFDA